MNDEIGDGRLRTRWNRRGSPGCLGRFGKVDRLASESAQILVGFQVCPLRGFVRAWAERIGRRVAILTRRELL